MKPTRQLEYLFCDHRERPFKTNSEKIKIMMLVLTGMAFTLPSHADEPKLEGDKKTKLTDEEVFQGIDADSSGLLSMEEYRNAMFEYNYTKLFRRLDKDGDGKISLAEFKKVRILTAEESFRRLDTDSNGFISMDEFTDNSRDPEALSKIFRSQDADGDGKLSFAEFKGPTPKGKKKK